MQQQALGLEMKGSVGVGLLSLPVDRKTEYYIRAFFLRARHLVEPNTYRSPLAFW